jgi:hypothetical protein
MSQFEKLKEAFKRCKNTFPYGDFERLIGGLGYGLVKAGLEAVAESLCMRSRRT